MKRDFFVVLLLLFSISIFGAVYEKVTSAPSDWSGQYLIVYETGKVAFDGSRTTLDAVSNTQTVTIKDNKITIDTDIYFTITKSGDKYTIKSASGYFIGQTSNANGLTSNASTTYANTLSLNNSGNVNFVSGGAYLRYNAASNQKRFRYYKSSTYTAQEAIQLYRLVEGTEEQTYRVTLYNGGVPYDTLEGDFVNLPNTESTLSAECQFAGWEFAGWSETEITEDISEVELVDNPYIPKQDCSLYAVYKQFVSSNKKNYTFIPKSRTEATSSPALPMGASISFNNTHTDKVQMTSGTSQTWTITGLDVPLIAASASMKTNKSSGTGKINIKVGDEVVYDLFSYSQTYGYSAEFNDRQFELTSTDKVGDIVVTINAEVNSLYCQSLTITVGEDEFLYNTNPICAEVEEFEIMFGDVTRKTVFGKIVDIPELPESCNPEYQFKVGWTMATEVGVVGRPVLVNENTFFTQDTKLYPVYSKELDEAVWRIVVNEVNIVAGDQIVIAAKDYDYAISKTQNTNNRGCASITRNGDYITLGEDVKEIKVESGLLDNTFAFNVGGVYLYAASNSNNHLKTEVDLSGNSSWKIMIVDKVASIVAQGNNTHNVMRYNNSNKLFSCYLPNNEQKDLVIYKKVETEYYICGDVEIESGEVYVVDEDLVLNTLTIKSNYDEAGQISVTAGTLTAQKVIVEKTIDDFRWYFFSLPFDCELADVVAEDNEGNVLEYASDATSGDYVINEYDQVRSNETGKAWRELLGTQHTLNAGQGYIIGHFGIGEVIVRFTSAEEQVISVPGNKVLSYTDTWIVDGENSTRGFNLIGLPYYESVGGELQPTLVTIPNDDGITYEQVEYVDEDITPFTSFFVQTESAPIFTVEADPVAVPMMCAKGILEKMVLTFSSADGVGCDKTTIINNPNSTIEYEIGRDLVKWIGYADIPQVYSVQGDDILAFNSMAVDNSMAIPLGVYVPSDGEYVFAFDEKSVGDVCEWVFVDKELDTETFLGEEDYNIYIEKGKYEDRFELRKQQFVETGCSSEELDFDVWIENGTLFVDVWDVGVEVCVYDAVGRMIGWNRMVDGEMRFDCSERGVYLVVINRKSDLKTVKVVY